MHMQKKDDSQLTANHPEKTPEYFEGDVYLQHNTGIADGLSGLGAALEELAKQNIQMVYDKVHQVLAQGNYALAISEGTLGNAKTAYYDLWRIENGKIKEHWDVMDSDENGIYFLTASFKDFYKRLK